MSKNTKGTPEERERHRKATALRKLTDKQLVERFEVQTKASRGVAEFLKMVEESHIQGIGAATIAKLRKFAESNKF